MNRWPNAPEEHPTRVLHRDLEAPGGGMRLSMAELGVRFGVQRLTVASRTRIAADLREAGIAAAPSVETAGRSELVHLRVAEPAPASVAPPGSVVLASAPERAATTRPSILLDALRGRRRLAALAAAVVVALALLIAVTVGGHHADPAPAAAPAGVAQPAGAATSLPTTPVTAVTN